ncbi:major facilitator superfamily domain-containing protein [Astrocystis sublimbata]|nr:major facilitator superfamily domain-containing protein [Astrocystis sublimbata]
MWWSNMATAGQYGSGYTAVPPTTVDQGTPNSDVHDEDHYEPRQATAGWDHTAYHTPGASNPTTAGYAVEGLGQWQHHGTQGAQDRNFAQYNQAAAANPSMQWNHQYYQPFTNGVAVPQAVHYYYDSDVQYWNHGGVTQPVNNFDVASNPSQYHNEQHYAQPTAQSYEQHQGSWVTPAHDADTPLKISTNIPMGHPDGWQHRAALIDPIISETHPRQNLSIWKWRLMLVASNILSLINGYDVSNIANIQGPVYEAFGDIHLLPWLALSYSICNVVATPLARKLFKFYDIKVLTLSGLVLLIAGNALAGAASSLLLLIVGRAVTAFGASIVYQGILSFTVIFSYPGEIALVHASVGACFAFGILTGPVIGAAFAQNESTTWRWSFYINLPILVIVLLLCIFALPCYSASTEKSVSTHFKEIDWIGHLLHSGTFISFGLATVFSGNAWPWGSVPQLVIWVIFTTVAVAYIVQQTFSFGTKPEHRILPVHLLRKRIVLLTFICTLAAAMTYGVAFYYEPLFYTFTRAIGPLESGTRLLCLTALFIVAILLAHSILPVAKYYMPFFLVGGVLLLAGGISLHTVTSTTPLAAVMAFSAILGAGIGVMWNLAIPVCSAVLETQEERLDQTTLHSIAQLGGTAFSLSVSAAIYRNIGLNLVKDAAGFTGYQDTEILALLAGAKSTLLESFSPEIKKLVISAIVKTIGCLYFIVVAGAAICVIAALCLKIEPLQIKRWIKTKDAKCSKDEEEKSPVYELR